MSGQVQERLCSSMPSIVCVLTALATQHALAEALRSDQVVAIEWSRLELSEEANSRLAQCTSLLNHCAKYNLSWIDQTFALNREGDAYILTGFDEHGVRPACSVAYGMGALLQTAAFDQAIVGVPRAVAKERTVRLIRGIVRAHSANAIDGRVWGIDARSPEPQRYWQTALWSALSGMGGWLLWDELDAETQEMIVAMLDEETRRFFAADYYVPYWNGEGGDTKAEENSWNSMPLALMAAMMPQHPHAQRWRQRAAELMISSYATRDDWMRNHRLIAGRKVKDWLAGYNAEPGGVVVNHDIIHPDYMGAVSMNFWGLTTQRLAEQSPLAGWDFNAALIYETFVSKQWNAPPYEAPGGTIYVPHQARIYYPQGSDWSYHDLTIYYLMDVYAYLFRWHPEAARWLDLRATVMLKMQFRHNDRRMFAEGEYDTYPGREQWAFWCLTDASIPLWLDACHALGSSAEVDQFVPK